MGAVNLETIAGRRLLLYGEQNRAECRAAVDEAVAAVRTLKTLGYTHTPGEEFWKWPEAKVRAAANLKEYLRWVEGDGEAEKDEGGTENAPSKV